MALWFAAITPRSFKALSRAIGNQRRTRGALPKPARAEPARQDNLGEPAVKRIAWKKVHGMDHLAKRLIG
jgi:hypothetical protein